MELTLCIRAGEEDRKDVPSPRSLSSSSFFYIFHNNIKSVASEPPSLSRSSVAENESQRNIKSPVLE